MRSHGCQGLGAEYQKVRKIVASYKRTIGCREVNRWSFACCSSRSPREKKEWKRDAVHAVHAVRAVARDSRRCFKSSRLRSRRSLETNRRGRPSRAMLELNATEEKTDRIKLTNSTHGHGGIIDSLCCVGRSPISRVTVTGEGAVAGIILWLQGRDMRVECCQRWEKLIWRGWPSAVDASSRLKKIQVRLIDLSKAWVLLT